MGEDHRLRSVTIDQGSLGAASRDVEHEREVAIFDLIERNTFRPEGAPAGPYDLKLSCVENRLVFEIAGDGYARAHVLSLSPLKRVIRDYLLICESYYEAIRHATPSHIEAVDMGRRGLHNEASELLRERLAGKIETDTETARRLFTLICALHLRV